MVIKYKCWQKATKQWRTPDTQHMVSRFAEGDGYAMRIVAPSEYELVLFTGSEDIEANDVYAGDILDDKYYVYWDILNGRWGVYDRETREYKYSFSQYKPSEHIITGTIFEEVDFEDVS